MFSIQRLAWGLLAALVVAAATGCDEDDDKNDKEQTAPRKVPVETVEVERRDMRETIVSTSAVDSRHAVDIVAEVPGVVVNIDVEQGDRVQKRQRLARVQREELNLGVDNAQAAVDRLQREVDRLRPLHDKGIISRQVLDEAVYKLDEARAERRRAKTAASDLRVTSPMDGVVAVRHVDPGQQVATGAPMFRVVDPAELVVHVNLPEGALEDVYEGQETIIESDALGGARFGGEVERVSPVVDPRTGTVRVTVALARTSDEGSDEQALPKPESGEKKRTPRLRPGMFVKTYIVTARRPDVLTIPRRAVTTVDGSSRVFVVDDGIAVRKDVETGITEGAVVEIRDGLSEGERVVVLGQEGLKNGTPVIAEAREDPPAAEDGT